MKKELGESINLKTHKTSSNLYTFFWRTRQNFSLVSSLIQKYYVLLNSNKKKVLSTSNSILSVPSTIILKIYFMLHLKFIKKSEMPQLQCHSFESKRYWRQKEKNLKKKMNTCTAKSNILYLGIKYASLVVTNLSRFIKAVHKFFQQY